MMWIVTSTLCSWLKVGGADIELVVSEQGWEGTGRWRTTASAGWVPNVMGGSIIRPRVDNNVTWWEVEWSRVILRLQSI